MHNPLVSRPTDSTNQPAWRSFRSAVGTSISGSLRLPRVGPNTIDSSPSGWRQADVRWWPTRPPEPISPSTKCSWRISITPTRYYVKNGKPTTEPVNIRLAIRPLRQLYGHTLAREFGPLRLKTVRQAMIDSGLCRSEINKRVRHVLRAFKWAVGEEMVPPSLHHGLKAVPGLRRGRADVRESEPVRPVPDAFVDAIRPHVSRQVWAMVELQRLSGMRPGEVCSMRTIDVDTSGRVWIYTPESHKTEHHGRERRIYLGPKAQEILRPWLRPELTAYLFSPAEAEAERRGRTDGRAGKPGSNPPNGIDGRRKPRKAPGREIHRRFLPPGD